MVIHLCNKHLSKAFYVSSTIQIIKKRKMSDVFLLPRKLKVVVVGMRVGGEEIGIYVFTNHCYRPNERDGTVLEEY